MASKKSEDAPTDAPSGTGDAQATIEARVKAKQEAVDQTGVEPPEVDPNAGVDTTLGKPE